jgi:hypothetical protein
MLHKPVSRIVYDKDGKAAGVVSVGEDGQPVCMCMCACMCVRTHCLSELKDGKAAGVVFVGPDDQLACMCVYVCVRASVGGSACVVYERILLVCTYVRAACADKGSASVCV